jgi:hypothetical protein
MQNTEMEQQEIISTIQSGIVPPVERRGGYTKYPWGALEVGDSFFVPHKTIQKISAVAVKIAMRRNTKYTCRSVSENQVSGVRVWRVR